MSRDWQLYVADMIDACEKIVRYTHGLEYAEFQRHDVMYDAIVRNFVVIGEAAKNVPPEVRDRHSQVQWSGAARLRDVAVHGYFYLQDESLWAVATERVPPLLRALRAIPLD